MATKLNQMKQEGSSITSSSFLEFLYY